MSIEKLALFTKLDSPFTMAAAILGLSYIAALVVNVIFGQIITRVLNKTKTESDDKIIKTLKTPVFWSILLLGVYIVNENLELSDYIHQIIKNLIASVATIIWLNSALATSQIVFAEFTKQLQKKDKSTDAVPFLRNVAKAGIVVISIFIFLNQWGVDITPLLASAGVIGLAIAFAAKDTVANLFGGLSVFFDKPYKIGDYVIIEDKYRGEVIQIGLRSTKIKTRDNVLLTVPNSVMVTNSVINETGFDPKLRIRIPLGVSYNSNLEEIEKVLVDEIKKHTKVLSEPTPRVRFRKFGESSIELEILGVIDTPPERGRTIHELIKKIHKRLSKEKIEIPYPKRDIYLYKNEG